MKSFLKKLFVRNIRYKIFALLLAIAIWYSITIRSFELVPVGPIQPEFSHPQNFQVLGKNSHKIYFTVNCPDYIRNEYRLTPEQFTVLVVLGPKTIDEKQLIDAEDHTVTLQFALHKGLVRINLPERAARLVSVDSIRPDPLELTVSLITQQVPILTRIVGEPQEGYVVGEPQLLSLQEIELTGSPAALDSIRHVDLHPIDVSGLSKDVTRQVDIDMSPLEDLKVKTLRDSDKKIYVRIPVEKASQVKTFSSIPVVARGGPVGAILTIVPDNIEIEVEGRSSIFQAVDPKDLIAEVDLTGFGWGNHEIPPRVRGLPKTLQLIRRSVPFIEVEIEAGVKVEEVFEGEIVR